MTHELDADRAEALFRIGEGKTRQSKLALLVVALLPAAVVASITAAQHSLWQGTNWSVFNADIRHLWGGRAVCDTQFPFLRDYPSLVVLLFLSLTIWLANAEACQMKDFLSNLLAAGLAEIEAPNTNSVHKELALTNARFRRVGSGAISAAVAFVALAIALLLNLSLRSRHGNFSAFTSPCPGWSALRAQHHWWAYSSRLISPSSVTYTLGGSLVVYVILKHNLMGGIFVLFFRRTIGLIEYGYDDADLDGSYGWNGMRRLLIYTYTSLGISAVAFFSMFLAVPAEASAFLTPFVLLYALASPIYAYKPLQMFDRQMQVAKQRRRQAIRNRVLLLDASAHDEAKHYEVDLIERTELAHLRSQRPRLFRFRDTAIGFSLYLLPLLALIASLAH